MATSTNFGWAEPDNSGLVKNGAQDIRTLGNAIDVSLWNASKTINPVLNSNMSVWQRGTSVAGTTGTAYTADRWALNTSGNAGRTVSRQATNDTTNLAFIQYCARVQRDSGQTNTTNSRFYNMFETVNTIPLAGKQVTFSWYARKSATFSGTQIIYSMQYGTGTDQNYFSGYTGSTTIVYASSSPTTTWVRYTTTQTVPVAATELAIGYEIDWSGTAGASDYVEITGVQIDLGSTALPYRPNGQTYQAELAACQRYYYRIGGDVAYQSISATFAKSTTQCETNIYMPVTMRIPPSSVEYSTIGFYDGTTITAINSGSINVGQTGKQVANLVLGVASGLTQFRPYQLFTNNSTSGYLALSAEL